MKKVLNILISLIFALFVVFAIFQTICILKQDEYGKVRLSRYQIVSMKQKNDKYNKGDLLIIKDSVNYYVNDEVIYFESEYDYDKVGYGKISNVNQLNDVDTIYTVGDEFVSKAFVLGNVNNISSISFYGRIFDLATTKVGYMLLVVVPFLIIFVYELISIIKESLRKN